MDDLSGALTDSCSRVQVPVTARSQQLRVVFPPNLAGETLALADGLVLGRMPAGQPGALAHSRVSREHAVVRLVDNQWQLEDLGSRNGTRVNAERLTAPRILVEQDVVRLGDVVLVFDSGLADGDSASNMPGASRHIASARRQLKLASRSKAHLLIAGETGSGKEYVAREAHRLSGRTGAFVEVNCGALPPQLAASLFFGHKRGAFTGAQSSEAGLFRAAQGGTLFLDEIAELPLEIQPMFLRVLQDGRVTSVGATRSEQVDVCVVAATNKDLTVMVEEGRFRRDLHARLSAWFVRVPPLRERRVDMMQWIDVLSADLGDRRTSGEGLQIHADLAEWLLLQDWPDNLRGLQRVVERLSALGQGEVSLADLRGVMPELVEAPAAPSRPATAELPSGLPPIPTESEFRALWAEHAGSIRRIATLLKRDRKQIRTWAARYSLDK